MLPVALIAPADKILAPVTLPITLIAVPVNNVALMLPPVATSVTTVKFPPRMLPAAVMLPEALTTPAVRRLPPCTEPLTLSEVSVPTAVMLGCEAVAIVPK